MDTITVGTLVLDIKNHKASIHGTRVRLGSKQWKLVEALALCFGGLVTRDYLFAYLHPNPTNQPNPRTLDVLVYSVRKKLSAFDNAPHVHTIPSGGYVLRSA